MTLKTLAITGLILATTPALAENPDIGRPAEVSLLEGWRLPDGQHMAAIKVTLADGWKTYWRAPGEGGVPPEIDWGDSENVGDVRFHWPVPEVIDSGGMTTIGYKHELILPIEITPTSPDADVTIDASVLLGICEHICVPLQGELTATLAAAQTTATPEIAWALDARPDTSAEAGLTAATCEVAPLSDGMRVTAHMTLPEVSPEEWVVFEERDPNIWVSEAQVKRDGDTLIAVADFVPPDGRPYPIAGEDLRMTILGAGRAVDVQGCDIEG